MREVKILREALNSLPARVAPKAIGVSPAFWSALVKLPTEDLKGETFQGIPIKIFPTQHFEYRFLWD